MKLILKTIGVLAALIFILFLSGIVYVVDETKQVVITQFGRPVGEAITTAGLHFKAPFVQRANYFEKRLLQWDGDAKEVPTKLKKFIWLDTTARWKIEDPLKFFQSVGTENGAHSKLDNIINSATRDVISSHPLVDAVRNSNRILEGSTAEVSEVVVASEESVEEINIGREGLEKLILEKSKGLAPQYGIELIDVRIKRINYIERVSRKVYERMIAERKRAAEHFRSEGQGKKAEIEGQMSKELKQITSEAYRKAQGIRGKADAEVTKIYAEAYSKDPEFYAFLKTLDTYRETIDKDTTIILTTDSDYYKYLKRLEE